MKNLNTCSNKSNPTEEDKQKMMELHDKFEAIFVHEANGVYI